MRANFRLLTLIKNVAHHLAAACACHKGGVFQASPERAPQRHAAAIKAKAVLGSDGAETSVTEGAN